MDRYYDGLGVEGLSMVKWCLPASEIAQLDVKPFIERVTARRISREKRRRLEEICKKFPEYPCLLTIPGYGPDVSSKVLGAIGEPDRFQNGKQVLKMAGLDLSADRSGKDSEKAIPEISKRGKADLRDALYQAALIASVQNRNVMVYYTKKLRGREREKGIQIKMRVKLAAKLLVIAWTLMKKKEKFNPAYLNAE
jgi:transposase